MKATQGTTYRMLGSRLNTVATQLEELRSIGATGKKLNNPSDDPASIRPVLNTRKQLSNVDRYLETMGKSLDTMQATDGHLEHVENIMQRAKEIMTNAINGSLNDADRSVLADEIAQIRKELLDAANGMVGGKYLFAGYEEDTVPFVTNPAYDPALYDPTDSTTWPYLYQGDENSTSLEITTGELIQVNLTGNDLFFGTSSWDPANPNSIEPGRYDLFAELTQAEEAIRANDQTAMQTSLADLEGAAEQNRRLRSQLGNRASRVETAMDYQEGVRVDLKQILSRYEDADAIESFNAIVQQETAFQAALNVTAKVSQLSILDFI
ncbi:flagellar hook-associated protein 3 [Desulfobulbus propionicus DSM 2032]|uniref:Flagellar hook-associated protein 3 n=1 Tax=Desulfobulbus propionicus (strain ATCC 33891 / DSM 2032 / VKM B-1956 / 1pr3) TaxID=577650 RepID=A0A7U4DPS8_DESPD|nr:flagellar hook-associated protein FlgL [Desulfobulbus propionicus]ADW18399.1 flagellar hook-associated protein 3 [Desulfobulbus propionicus DSM 2032]